MDLDLLIEGEEAEKAASAAWPYSSAGTKRSLSNRHPPTHPRTHARTHAQPLHSRYTRGHGDVLRPHPAREARS
jgi:hypothetical protein